MNKEDGFGIDGPMPIIILNYNMLSIDLNHEREFSQMSPYIDPRYDAAYLLTEWFLKINDKLNENQEVKTELGRKFSGNFVMNFSLIQMPKLP
jgi:hypothetical protein